MMEELCVLCNGKESRDGLGGDKGNSGAAVDVK